jgi:N-acetylglucosamine-6-sulfatase
MRATSPTRRIALATAVSLIALVVGPLLQRSTPVVARPITGEPVAAKPNLVLILTDDQRWDSMLAMPSVRTLLGGHGVTFRNAFVTTALCCPSRASILTGKYSRHTGVYQNVPPHGGAVSFDDSSTLATWLKGADYTNAYVGKYLNAYWQIAHHIPPGWDDWVAITSQPTVKYRNFTMNQNGKFVDYGSIDRDYSTSVLQRFATRFLTRAKPPFFLHFAPVAPHPPADPLPRDTQLFKHLPPPSPSFDEPDVSDKPWAALHPRLGPKGRRDAMTMHTRTLESLRPVDRAVAAIVKVLTNRGLLDNTVIVFMSDNGLLLGEHRLSQKIWPYEESIRVPMVVRIPWLTKAQVDDHVVLNIDLAPTFAELAGVAADHPDGRSLLPLLQGEQPLWRSSFVAEYLGPDQGFSGGPPPFEAIRTTRYLYVEYKVGWRELYDLQTDPYELHNLAGQPRFEVLQASLAAQLLDMIST